MINKFQFTAVIFLLFLLFISTRIVHISLGHILTFMIAVLLFWYINFQETSKQFNSNEELDSKLKVIGNPSHFYYDVNLIEFFYSIRYLQKRRPDDYAQLVGVTNTILKIEKELNNLTEQYVEEYEIALEKAKIAMNILHGFVFDLNNPYEVEDHIANLTRYQQLIQRHLEEMKKICQRRQYVLGLDLYSAAVINENDDETPNGVEDMNLLELF